MRATATRGVRQVTTPDFPAVERRHNRLAALADEIARASGKRRTQLREEAEQLRREISRDEFGKVDSPSLRLGKYVHIGENSKRFEIEAVASCHQQHARVPPYSFEAFPGAVTLRARLGGRLIVNQAGGILENAGLCLHRHFGCPFIPGSAVKGMAAHAAWEEWMGARDSGELSRARDLACLIAAVFGFPTSDGSLDSFLRETVPDIAERAGCVCFMPAFPVHKPEIIVDIVNCHHPAYYQGPSDRRPAYDNENPNPQFFPAVEAGAVFRFTLVPTTRPLPEWVRFAVGDPALPLTHAKRWLIAGLTVNGIGAKTAAGYGWFEYDADKDRQLAEEQQAKAEAERREREEAEAERRRHESMTPEELLAEKFCQVADDLFKAKIGELPSADPTTQKAMLLALKTASKKHIWEADKAGKKKAARRAEIVRRIAAELGVEMP